MKKVTLILILAVCLLVLLVFSLAGQEIPEDLQMVASFYDLESEIEKNLTTASLTVLSDYLEKINIIILYNSKNLLPVDSNSLKKLVAEVSFLQKFSFVQEGSFSMGSVDGDPNENPIHNVNISSFYISRYEISQSEYEAVMGYNPSAKVTKLGEDFPVNRVSWFDTIKYCNRRSVQEGLVACYTVTMNKINLDKTVGIPEIISSVECNFSANGYRLPTEAEWEYAAKGGIYSQNYTYSGSNFIGEVAWYYNNSSYVVHNQGEKHPNELGIYDMSGNISEWCWDWYGSYPTISQNDPTGPLSYSYDLLNFGRVARGGGWRHTLNSTRLTARDHYFPWEEYEIGFRVVRHP